MDPQFVIKNAGLRSYTWIRILNISRRWIAPPTTANENPMQMKSHEVPRLPPLNEKKMANAKIKHPTDVAKYNDS
jgi:hypothetical protein